MTSISHRGQVNIDIQQDCDSDGNESKKDTCLETIMKLEQDDKDGGDGRIVTRNESRQMSMRRGGDDTMMEREEEADHTVQIPTNHGSAGYVIYIKGEKGCDVADTSKIKLTSIPDNWKPKKENVTLKE